MIEPASISMHQDVAFLLKSDMAEHQIMQSMMRQVGREFATADLVAASLAIRATQKPDAELRAGRGALVESIEAIAQTHQLNYPMVLKRGIEKFGLLMLSRNKSQSNEDTSNTQSEEPGSNSDEVMINEEDITVFRAVDQMMPTLQDEGLCAGMQVGLYRTPEAMSSLWRNKLVVILLPIDGQLGNRDAVFVFLLRRGFEAHSIQGRLSMHAGNPIQQLPCQELEYRTAPELVISSLLRLEKIYLAGKSFLLGMINTRPPVQHWLDLDQRDMD